MALQNETQFHYLKNVVVENGIHDYGIGGTLTSKLASLSLQTVKESMSTPPALLTPSPPPSITPLDFLNNFNTAKKPNFRIEIIKPEDSERLLKFLRKNFFMDEPLNIAVNLIEGENDRCLELEEFSTTDLDRGLSIMAVGNDGKIKGCVLGTSVYRNNNENGKQEEEGDPIAACKHPRFKKILKFLMTMDKKCNIFQFYPELDSYYELKIVSVDSNCRGEGVASILMQKSIELARASDLGFVKVDCSSHISGIIVEKMGFQTNFCIPYSEYKDDDEIVFKTEEPHTHFRVKSLRLKSH